MTTHELAGESLCSAYNRITNGCARVKIYEREIWEFLKSFNEADLVLVVQYMQSENRKNEHQFSLALGKLLMDLPRFNDLLSLATERAARMKGKTRTNREQVIFESRRVDEQEQPKPLIRLDAESMANAIRNITRNQ